jgi:SAM-dependent methyltransferase
MAPPSNFARANHKRGWEGEAKLDPGAPVAYFGAHRSLPDLEGYRSLCNGLKAALIESAVQGLKRTGGARGPRLSVLDVGSGRGGDIAKWCRYRPRLYLGLDASAASVAEAERRHQKLVSDGRGALAASFAAVDIRSDQLPIEDGGADVASLQFSMQFAFDTEAGAKHLIAELARAVRPGGLVVAVLPDGDRVAAVLTHEGPSQSFGHFCFRKFECTSHALASADPPVGIPYSFTLGTRRDTCPEYLVSPSYLDGLLREAGFEGALAEGRTSVGAHDFYAECPQRSVVAVLTKARPCSAEDWLTLGAFRVVMARRVAPQSEPEAAP